MGSATCSHFKPKAGSKACLWYSRTDTAKVGLCKVPRKLAFLCHYSEVALGKFENDGIIVKIEEL